MTLLLPMVILTRVTQYTCQNDVHSQPQGIQKQMFATVVLQRNNQLYHVIHMLTATLYNCLKFKTTVNNIAQEWLI